MKKVININFQGTVVPIEESSYELLQQYIESLRRYFANEEGKDEIINDIESRISELFQERLKAGTTCITDDDVNAIIKNMGRPQDFEEADEQEKTGAKESGEAKKPETLFNTDFNWKGKKLYRDENHKILGGVCSGVAAYFGIDPVIVRILFILFAFTGFGVLLYLLLWIFVPGSNLIENGVRKRLYRNPDGKIIGGVCSGLGSYFNINPWIPRVLFLIPFISFIFRWGHWGMIGYPHFLSFSFSPGAFIIYIILWLVVPEASTTSEKLEMKGEKVDLNSIKKSVLQEMRGVSERVGKLGMEAGAIAKEKGPEIGQQIHQAASHTGSALGKIIVTLLKIVMYFILGCIALSLVVALFGIAIAAIGIFPLKDFVLNNGWQTVFAWGTLIFFIGVPVVGVITFIIRRIARVKSRNNFMGWSFGGLWVLGWVFFMLLLSSVARDFKGISSMNETQVALSNPNVKSLEVKPFQNADFRRNNWFNLEPFNTYGIADDTALIGNVKIRITKSPNDSFQVTVMKLANGRTRRYADTLAALIPFNVSQQDSVLMLDRAITINTTDKFRNQNVEVTIAVPVGHFIQVDKMFNYQNLRVTFNSVWTNRFWYYFNNGNDYDFKYGVKYVMKDDGLYTLEGKPSSKSNGWNDNSADNPVTEEYDTENSGSYRYNSRSKIDSLKNVQEKQIQKMQASVDSLKAAREKEVNRIKDSLQKAKEEIDRKIETLNKGTAINSGISPAGPDENYSFIMNI